MKYLVKCRGHVGDLELEGSMTVETSCVVSDIEAARLAVHSMGKWLTIESISPLPGDGLDLDPDATVEAEHLASGKFGETGPFPE